MKVAPMNLVVGADSMIGGALCAGFAQLEGV